MNTSTRTRLRITGFALVVAALISNWLFDRKAQPPTLAAPRAQVAKMASGAPASDASAERAALPCTHAPTNPLPGQAASPLAANCDAVSQ